MENCKFKNILFKRFSFDFSSISSQVQVKGIINTSAYYPNNKESFVVVFNYTLVDDKMQEKNYLSFEAQVGYEMINNNLFKPESFDDDIVNKAFLILKNKIGEIEKSFPISKLPFPSEIKAPVFKTV